MMGEERWVGESDDDSRGVEISIAGGGAEMVRGPISWSEPSALYSHLPTTLTLVTYHLALHKPL